MAQKSHVGKNILLISSGGINFVIPAANFCFCQVYFIRYYCSKTNSHQKIFSAHVILGQILVNMFSSVLLDFVTKLILKSQRNPLENINKKSTKNTAIPMENASNILNIRCSPPMGFCD
jgi:hypothetical protein